MWHNSQFLWIIYMEKKKFTMRIFLWIYMYNWQKKYWWYQVFHLQNIALILLASFFISWGREEKNGLCCLNRRTQFSQLFIMQLKRKKKIVQIFFPPLLNNLLVPIGKKPAPGDHESDDISFLCLTNLIQKNYCYIKDWGIKIYDEINQHLLRT